MVRKWRKLVEKIKSKPKIYRFLLQGFFAGEGNIKNIASTKSRVLRISQGKPNKFIEDVFKVLGFKFTFEPSERSYVISGRENLEKLWGIEISRLHPLKDEKFRLMLKGYKQRHLKRGQLKKEILNSIDKPKSTRELSIKFGKSASRISRTLSMLNRESLVEKFRVRSTYYWILSNRNIVIISKTKWRILKLLNKPRRVYELAEHLGVSWKSPFRRLKELEKLKLVKQKGDLWYKTPIKKEVMVL